MHVREECNSIWLAHCNSSDTIDKRKDAVKQNHTEQNQKGPDDTYTCIWLSVALKQTCFAPTDDAHEDRRSRKQMARIGCSADCQLAVSSIISAYTM